MTPEASDLAAAHVRNAVSWGRRLFPHWDEAGSAAAEALCHAAIRWVEIGAQGEFWPWARTFVRFRITDEWRVQFGRLPTDRRRVPLLSLAAHADGEELAAAETLGDDDPGYDQIDDADLARHLRTVLPARHLAIIDQRADGRLLADIGADLGVTVSRVCQIIAEARREALRHVA